MTDPRTYFAELNYSLPEPRKPIRAKSTPQVTPSGCKIYEFPKPVPMYVIGVAKP